MVALLASAGEAHANGRFPSAFQLAFSPADADHFVLSTTFGLIETRDGGHGFSWICEPALRLSGTLDQVVAITENDVTVVTNAETILTSEDGCEFVPSRGLVSSMPPDLSLSRTERRELLSYRTTILPEERFDSQVMFSNDEGRSWHAIGAALPDNLLPITIDVAPSDRNRVYISARLGSEDDFVSVLLRSDDGGESFEHAGVIPDTAGLRLAYIAAVHPTNPDAVFVRIADPPGTVVKLSADAGESFETLFTAAGPVLGFAVSEDELALGGPNDGLWMGSADGTMLERRSDVGPHCLAFGPDALYVCADWTKDGFSLGRMEGSGAQVEPLMSFADLCGATACDADTQVGTSCASVWQEVAPRLGATCGLVPASGGASSGGDSSAAEGGASNSEGGTSEGGAVAGSDPKPEGEAEGSGVGSSCGLGNGSSGQPDRWASLLTVVAIGLYRVRRKETRRPTK